MAYEMLPFGEIAAGAAPHSSRRRADRWCGLARKRAGHEPFDFSLQLQGRCGQSAAWLRSDDFCIRRGSDG